MNMRAQWKQGLNDRSTFIYPGALIATTALYLKLPALAVLGIALMVYPALGIDINKTIYSPSFQRKTAWVLMGLSILEAITGFGAGPTTAGIIYEVTLGLLNRGLSLQLHIILIAPLAFFFILHITSGIGMALIRRRILWPPLYNYIIPTTLILAFVTIMYLYSQLVII